MVASYCLAPVSKTLGVALTPAGKRYCQRVLSVSLLMTRISLSVAGLIDINLPSVPAAQPASGVESPIGSPDAVRK